MPPKSSSDNLAYKQKIKLDLDKLKHGDIQKVKVDLNKFNKENSKTNWSDK